MQVVCEAARLALAELQGAAFRPVAGQRGGTAWGSPQEKCRTSRGIETYGVPPNPTLNPVPTKFCPQNGTGAGGEGRRAKARRKRLIFPICGEFTSRIVAQVLDFRRLFSRTYRNRGGAPTSDRKCRWYVRPQGSPHSGWEHSFAVAS